MGTPHLQRAFDTTADADGAWEPISLGFSCATKFQVSRKIYLQETPDGTMDMFRRLLLSPRYRSSSFERHVFDWIITQFHGVNTSLECNFEGCFERADLTVRDGDVYHMRLCSRHPHDFHPSNLERGLTEADIDEQYADFRSKYEHLARRFVGLRERPGRYLYVVASFPYAGHVRQVLEWLGAGSPEHNFKLLLIGQPHEGDQPYEALGERLAWTRIPAEVRKPLDAEWEGDDEHWDLALSPYRLKAPAWTVRPRVLGPHTAR